MTTGPKNRRRTHGSTGSAKFPGKDILNLRQKALGLKVERLKPARTVKAVMATLSGSGLERERAKSNPLQK